MQKFNLREAIIAFAVVLVLLISLLEFRPSRSRDSICEIHCRNLMKDLYCAFYMYSEDYNNYFPDKEGRSGFEMLRAGGYNENGKMYTCPSTTDRIEDGVNLETAQVSYMYIAGLNQSSPSDMPLARDNEFRHKDYKIGSLGIRFTNITLIDGLNLYPYKCGNVLFADGHVEECKKERWEEIIKKYNFTY